MIEGEQVQEDGINDVIYENEEEANEGLEEQHGEEQIEEVYTATSKQMANQKAARGYYDTSGKGKSKSSKGGKGKGRGGGSNSFNSSSNSSKGKDSYNKGKGKGGSHDKGKGQDGGGKTQRQIRFANSQCLGCGSTKHFLRDCPNVTTYQAHLASALAPGSLSEAGEFQSWMVSCGGGSGDGMRERSRSRDDSPAVPAAPRTAPPDDFYAEQVEEEEDPAEDDPVDDDSGSTGPYVDQLPYVFSETDLFATDFQYTNMLHDVGFRRIIRDFDRAVQPKKGQCTPDEPHGHWVCPANLIGWRFD